MRYAISAPNMTDPNAIVDIAIEADRAGWDGFFVWDHIQFIRAAALDIFDPWTILGAAAYATERIRLGAVVTPVPRRRPWKLAKEITTIDHLSGGRAIVGVGLGWPSDDEFGAFGDETDTRVRASMLDEGLVLLDRFLRGEPVVHEGAYYRIDAHLRPATLQQPRPPIWVAAMGARPGPTQRAARWDGVVPLTAEGFALPPDGIAEIARQFKGRDGFEVVAAMVPGATAAEYADAGATWLIRGAGPDEPDWPVRLRREAAAGPPVP